jgi:cation transport regulator ChaC
MSGAPAPPPPAAAGPGPELLADPEPIAPDALASLDPLWVFGYGSLVWRVDFETDAARDARVAGVVRRVWWRSPDHRGTAAAPGRVVTLVAAAVAARVAGEPPTPPAPVLGRAYRVPRAAAAAVVAHLLHRERAGYEPALVRAVCCDDGSVLRAVAFLGNLRDAAHSTVAWDDDAGGGGGGDGGGGDGGGGDRGRGRGTPEPLAAVAAVVASSVGASGRNLEYLARLRQWLRERGENDAHLEAVVQAAEAVAEAAAVTVPAVAPVPPA